MNFPAQVAFVSVEEYLQGELASEIRHEYIAGQVYAMAGAGEKHNRLAGNVFYHLRSAARGGPCGVFISDMKVRVEQNDAFYYPDVMLTCDPQDTESLHKSRPCVIVEVLSPATELTDRREKLAAYRTLKSLRYYLLVAQDKKKIECFFLGEDDRWQTFLIEETGQIDIDCNGFKTVLTLDDVYEDVRLS